MATSHSLGSYPAVAAGDMIVLFTATATSADPGFNIPGFRITRQLGEVSAQSGTLHGSDNLWMQSFMRIADGTESGPIEFTSTQDVNDITLIAVSVPPGTVPYDLGDDDVRNDRGMEGYVRTHSWDTSFTNNSTAIDFGGQSLTYVCRNMPLMCTASLDPDYSILDYKGLKQLASAGGSGKPRMHLAYEKNVDNATFNFTDWTANKAVNSLQEIIILRQSRYDLTWDRPLWPISQGDTIYVEVWIKVSDHSDGAPGPEEQFGMDVTFWDAYGRQLGFAAGLFAMNPTTEWTKTTVTFIIDDNKDPNTWVWYPHDNVDKIAWCGFSDLYVQGVADFEYPKTYPERHFDIGGIKIEIQGQEELAASTPEFDVTLQFEGEVLKGYSHAVTLNSFEGPDQVTLS